MTDLDAAAPAPPETGELEFISYADFGQRFFEIAVTSERIESVAAGLAGRPIEIGPLGVGPLGLVKVRADGAVGDPAVTRRTDEHVAFDVAVPADLEMVIEIGLDRYRFSGRVGTGLVVTARAAERLKILIDIEQPTRDSITVDLRADGLRASVLQVVAGIETEVKKAILKFVRSELDKPHLREARIIDVEAALARLAMPTAPAGPATPTAPSEDAADVS